MKPGFHDRKRLIVTLFCLTGWIFAILKPASLREPITIATDAPVITGSTQAPVSTAPFRSVVSAGSPAPSVHAATAVELIDGTIRAFWFGGTGEGASDVAIWSADLVGDNWTEARVAVDREMIARGTRRYIKNLGNPVAYLDENNTLTLFVVSVSLGRWSGSAINRVVFEGDGIRIREVSRLVGSPILNLGTLVRGAALARDNGGLLLPGYQELTKQFPLLLQLDREGRVVSRESLTIRGTILQPWVLDGRESKSAIFFRRGANTEAKVFYCHREGETWTTPTPIPVNNPNSSVSAVRLDNGDLILAANPDTATRSNLVLLRADDPQLPWENVYTVDGENREDDEKDFHSLEYSYPWLMIDRKGLVHLFYTWNRKEIRHLRVGQGQLRGNGGQP